MNPSEYTLVFDVHRHGSESEGKIDGITVATIRKNKNHTHTNDSIYTVHVFGRALNKRFRGIEEAREAARTIFAASPSSALDDGAISLVMSAISPRPFHTGHFIDSLRANFPVLWRALVVRYGEGGHGAGKHYSAFSAVAHMLNRASSRGALDKLANYAPAPPDLNWGSPVIRYWTDAGGFLDQPYPDEPSSNVTFPEGAVIEVKVNRYERSKVARAVCISHFGTNCQGCGMDFVTRYGEHGRDFIHVHHLLPLNQIKKAYKVDPVAHLRPVCPNCHAMIHRREPMLSIEELRAIVK